MTKGNLRDSRDLEVHGVQRFAISEAVRIYGLGLGLCALRFKRLRLEVLEPPLLRSVVLGGLR